MTIVSRDLILVWHEDMGHDDLLRGVYPMSDSESANEAVRFSTIGNCPRKLPSGQCYGGYMEEVNWGEYAG